MIVYIPVDPHIVDIYCHDNLRINMSELHKLYYQVLEHQYISYEDSEIINFMRKLRIILEKFDERKDDTQNEDETK